MPPRPRRRARRIVRDLDALTFAAGWRLVEPPPLAPVDGLHVDLIRPDDLVALSCTFTHCDLRAGGDRPPTVEPRGGDALLIVEHGFQHAAEQATFEQSGSETLEAPLDAKDPPRKVPAGTGDAHPVKRGGLGFVPARSSRVVFDLADTTVEFSTEGILEAMTRLPLVLAAAAREGADAPVRGTRGAPPLELPPIIIHLGDGLVAEMRSSGGPLIRNATRDDLRAVPAPGPGDRHRRPAAGPQPPGLPPSVGRDDARGRPPDAVPGGHPLPAR